MPGFEAGPLADLAGLKQMALATRTSDPDFKVWLPPIKQPVAHWRSGAGRIHGPAEKLAKMREPPAALGPEFFGTRRFDPFERPNDGATVCP